VLWQQLTTLVRGEPPSIEDTAPGQTDDAVTALRYFVTMRPGLPGIAPRVERLDDDTHPGFDWERGERKERRLFRLMQEEEAPRGFRNRGPLVRLEE
jgi:hypothetical protein